jgi:cytochrome c
MRFRESITPRVVWGPPLGGVADRVFIAGMLQNNTENLTKWISDPQSVVPGNAMPAMA